MKGFYRTDKPIVDVCGGVDGILRSEQKMESTTQKKMAEAIQQGVGGSTVTDLVTSLI